MNHMTGFGLLCLVLCISFAHLMNVKIVRETNTVSTNSINLKPKRNASLFVGPSHLSYLVDQCFTYASDRYEYRVCPFNNVTQHEKVWHSGAYNGIIGIWKEWTVKNNSFDSLSFTDGDECENEIQRSAQLVWVCGQNVSEETVDTIIEIKEPKKCFYEIHFVSDFGCEDKYIYPHLNDEYKLKWDHIETYYFNEELTQFGYEMALKELFIESKIIWNTTNQSFNDITFDSMDNCLKEFVLLKEQNVRLEQRIEYFEKKLNKNV